MFTPSEKQDNAIKNMEKVIGMDEFQHETYFKSKEIFSKYFDELQNEVEKKIKQIKKSKNFKNAIDKWIINYKEIEEKKKKRISDWYNIDKNLKLKVLEYHWKWNASLGKMKKWMLSKTNNNIVLVEKVLETITIQEDFIVNSKIANALNSWKSLDFIKSKLIYTNLFNKETVENIIENNFSEIIVPEKIIKNIIEKGQRQKKTIYEIKSLLFPILKYQDNTNSLIENAIEKYYSKEKEDDNFIKEITKLVNRKYDNQKIIQKMIRKGYKYDKIKTFLQEQ